MTSNLRYQFQFYVRLDFSTVQRLLPLQSSHFFIGSNEECLIIRTSHRFRCSISGKILHDKISFDIGYGIILNNLYLQMYQ